MFVFLIFFNDLYLSIACVTSVYVVVDKGAGYKSII